MHKHNQKKNKSKKKKDLWFDYKDNKSEKEVGLPIFITNWSIQFQASIKAYQNSQSQILSGKDKGKDYSLGPQANLKIVFL